MDYILEAQEFAGKSFAHGLSAEERNRLVQLAGAYAAIAQAEAAAKQAEEAEAQTLLLATIAETLFRIYESPVFG